MLSLRERGLKSTLAADHDPKLHLPLHIQLRVRAAEVESRWTLEISQHPLQCFLHLLHVHQKFISRDAVHTVEAKGKLHNATVGVFLQLQSNGWLL